MQRQSMDCRGNTLLDAKDFAGLAYTFTKNATYRSGDGTNNHGIDNIQAAVNGSFPPELITQRAINTQSITLLPPFDEQGAAGTATGVVYTAITYIGQGDLAGQALAYFGKFDDEYVKTENYARYGGWRISDRFITLFGDSVGNKDVLPPQQRD